MSATSRTQPRQPSGTPVGGQFAGKPNPEPTIELSDEVVASVIRAAEAAHAKYQRMWGLANNTVAGDTLLAFVSSVARTGQVPECPQAWCRQVAKSLALRQLAGSDRTEVRQALAAYRSECGELGRALGRTLTEEEQDTIAANIRAAQRPTRKAPHNFHRQVQLMSIDSANMADKIPGGIEPSSYDDFEIGSIGDQVERMAAEGRTTEARRLAYSAIAERAGAPLPSGDALTERHAAAARKTIRDAGGVIAAIDQWRNGSPIGSAIFAPFGDDTLPDSEKDRVVDILEAHPKLANELWDSAVYTATKPRVAKLRT
jgi:hypothetical protein